MTPISFVISTTLACASFLIPQQVSANPTPDYSSDDEQDATLRIQLNQDLSLSDTSQVSLATQIQLCECSGKTLLNNECYSSMTTAIKKAESGDIIYIGGLQAVFNPIFLHISLSIVGVECDRERAWVSVSLDEVATSAFHLNSTIDTEPYQSLSLYNFDMQPTVAGLMSSAVRSDNWDYVRNLHIEDMKFEAFHNEINGSVLYLGQSGEVTIKNSQFIKNHVTEKRETGGTLYIATVPEHSRLTIGGLWEKNVAEGVHAEGAAVYLLWVYGVVEFTPDARFIENEACEAPAAEVRVIYNSASVKFNGYYHKNKAVDRGYGARGGAIRSLMIMSPDVEVSGTFTENESEGKGGVYAVNRLYKDGGIHISGSFIKNKAKAFGGVVAADWGIIGVLTISEEAYFEDNEAYTDDRNILQFRVCGLCNFLSKYDKILGQKEWEDNGPKAYTFEGGFSPSMYDEVYCSLNDDDKTWIQKTYQPKAWDMFIDSEDPEPDQKPEC
ncbi:hypothetical protein SARC_10921 [Sphaeroforma arctica JP610]|uniref:Right handed beta helix domain-containing protein n=1 Tax=Sphaeroforma arctica JP610 TaxID=667725 RepID=A0A0L0FIL9_9EUKA|nr:hypothetical protein SARC_10921 [Sphaeroforma arctica JP610]KNC76585.1 hypothetical protein SARC_10921 [Sphaeroforma arctica JP610]|eukprot:XP_014150487.1 hypothetical protein SARC_10921 [Sphaeroforma arctica JP610]